MYVIRFSKECDYTMEYQVEQVISELSKIDNASESIITSADVEKENYAKEMNQKTLDFDGKLEEDTKRHLEEFKVKLQADNDKILKQMRTNTEKDLQKLETAFNANHTEMAQHIFAELIKE